jgi:hypothetical protein
MTSVALGANISPVEVTNVSSHGFWLLLEAEELFLPFAEFPWFRDVAIGKILHVELPSPGHLYWPELDVGQWTADRSAAGGVTGRRDM